MNNYYWTVHLEIPVIALLCMSLLLMFHLRSCQSVSPVFTLETALRSLPEGPWHVPEQSSVLWQDKVPFLTLTAEFRQNAEQHVPPWCYFLFTLLKPGQTTYSCVALPNSYQEHLKDALGNSMCRITEKSIRLQSSLEVFQTVDSLEHPENVKTENCFMCGFWKTQFNTMRKIALKPAMATYTKQ